MNKFLCILTLVLVTLSSCNRKNVKPEVYNDSLVVHQIRVVEKADKLQDAFGSYVEKEMQYRHNELSNQINASILAVETMEPFNEDETYKTAALDMLNGYKNLLNKEYKAAEKILAQPDSLYSDGDEARLEMLYKQIDMLSSTFNSDFKKAQEKFSKDHKIAIKPLVKKVD
jgi:transcriptional regulator